MKNQKTSLVVATVWRHWKPTFKKNALALSLTFIFYSLSAYLDLMLKPTIYKNIFDELAKGENPLGLFDHVIYVLIFVFISSRLADQFIVYSEVKIIKELKDYTLKYLLQKDTKFFTSHHSGSLVAKAKRFANSSENVIDQFVFTIIRSSILAIYLVIYSFIVVPKIAWIFLVWIVFFSIATILISNFRMKYDVISANSDSKTTAYLSDILSSIFTMRIFSRTSDEYKSFCEVTKIEAKNKTKAWNFGSLQWIVQAFLMIALEIIVMRFIIKEVVLGFESIGTIVMIQSYILSLCQNMWNFGQSFVKVKTSFADSNEMALLLDEPNIEPLEIKNNTDLFKDNSIIFDKLNFSYFEGHPVIRDLSFHFRKGKHYGIIGKTGSGKTTLIKILLKLYSYDSGVVNVGGNPLNEINHHLIRSQIAYVPQQPIFPSRKVREIISLGKTIATDEEISIAIKKACCKFVYKLPQGLDTEIGERGVKLSGGECQRLAICAAILKDSPIIIMDEPTSALDADTERVIQDSIKNYFKDKTLIVIAHRLSTIAILDEIIFMRDGKIIANAPHEELLDISHDYKRMWELQTKPQI